MVAEVFETLLNELAKVLEVDRLAPDANNSCLVKLKNGVEIQMEPDSSGEFLIVGSPLGKIPEGHYRESLFEAALKHNGLPYPRHGTFAFSPQSGHIILHKKVALFGLTGSGVAAEVAAICDKATQWKLAIEKEDIPTVGLPPGVTGAGMFGLEP